MVSEHNLSLAEALSQYLPGLKDRNGQQELNRFIQWCGRDRAVRELTPSEVADYGESAGMWGLDSARAKVVKSFLSYLKDRRHIGTSLAPHLKVSKSKKGARRPYFSLSKEQAELTPEGYTKLQSRLEMLKEEKLNVISDIKKAMADKDFKENAPLDAAKERQGMIESSIRDLEGILANAVMTGRDTSNDKRIRLGKKVTLQDTATGKQVRYTLVDSTEADPVTGKISGVSPVGKSLLDRTIGDEVEINVPKGTLRYLIKKVEG